MVSRVGKFVGGFGADVTNTTNVHATENRVAFGHGDTNPTANVHVVGNILATTTVTATGGLIVPDDGDVGSASATDAMQISSAGIVTFKDDIKIKDGGTIGSASDADAIAISSGGVVTMNQIPVFSAGINVSGGSIAGTLSTAAQGNITSLGTLTTLTVDDITINGSTISDAAGLTIDAGGDIILDAAGNDIIFKDNGTEIGRFTHDFGDDFTIQVATQDKDILFKGDDGGSGITALSLDMSDAGKATFNGAITGGGLLTTGGNIVIPDAGNIGSASDTDAIAISSGGVVTMNQIPVFSAGINVSGGSIAGTLSTAAQGNITSLGTLTALTVDDINLNGKVVTITGDTSDTFTITTGAAGATTLATTDAAGTSGSLTLDADGSIVLDAAVSGGPTQFLNAGTRYGTVVNSGNNLHIRSDISDGDLLLRGNDGGSFITALTLDMSAAGAATFNAGITSGAGLIVADDGTVGSASATGAMTIDSSGIVTFVDDIKIKDGGTIGVASAADAMTVSSAGIVTFKDDILIKDGGTVGVASKTDAVTLASDGKVTLVDDLAVTGNAIATLGIGAVGNTVPRSNTISVGNPANVIVQANPTTGGTVVIGDPTYTSGTHSLDVRGTANIGAVTATTGTYSGRLVVDDATEATSTTDGSLQTDGGLSVAKDAVFGDDIKLITDESVAAFGVNGDVTLTHVHNTGLLLNAAMVMQFRDSAINIGSPADGDLDINADDEIELNSTLIDVNGNLDVSGTIVGASTLSATTGTFSGILKTDDATEATSTTDGSLQTDGGLSVVKDAVFGDDIKLLSDAAVAAFGLNGEITLTHVHNTGLLLEDSGGSPTLQLHDANESVSSDGSKLILTSNGVAFSLPTADGSANQIIKTDGSGTLSFADAATGDPDPATTLASDTDCGTAVAAADGQDAFGIAIDDAFVEIDLRTQAANKLGTVDMGALS